MVDQVVSTIDKYGLISPGDTIVMGVSGGPDSMAMAHILLKLRDQMRLKLVAVHVNHLLRGDDAHKDASYVKAFCSVNDIIYHQFDVDVTARSLELGESFEAVGRKVRYDCFEKVVSIEKADKVALAHHKNDVVETFFINLVRGAGIEGLSGIAYSREGKIIRPLLDVTRAQIESYCETEQLSPRMDITNDENHYLRNRIRNQLIPFMNTVFDGDVVGPIARSTEILKMDRAFWEIHVQRLYHQYCTERYGGVSINLSHTATLTEMEMVQLVRHVIRLKRGSLLDITMETINRIVGLNRSGSRIDLDDGYSFIRMHEQLVLVPRMGNDCIGELKLNWIRVPIDDKARYQLNEGCVAIDADKVKGRLSVRTRQPGDRFVPLGMTGSKKIKDYFIDEKIPVIEREKILLVCDEEKIIWVQDRRVSELCKITQETQNIIIMTFGQLVERH